MKRLAKLLLVVFTLTALAFVTPPAAQAEGHLVEVVHKGSVISVSLSALPAHLLHGDSLVLVPCPDGSLPPCE